MVGGTVVEAIFLAASLQPENKFVKHLKAEGIAGAMEVKRDCPIKIRAHPVFNINSF